MTARLGLEIFTTQTSAAAHVNRITVPTWVVHGDDDRIVPVESSAPLGALPNATRTVHPGLRHECLNEPEGPAIVEDLASWILGGAKPV